MNLQGPEFRRMIGWLMVLGSVAVGALAGEKSGTVQSTRLYTPPDPSATGGLQAHLVNPAKPALHVFAVPASHPFHVYKGQVIAGRELKFQGLPVDRYDLMVVYDESFYEGFVLNNQPDALTKEDHAAMEKMINKAVPFFEIKKIHRWEGTTGADGKARCVVQELRAKPTLTQNGDTMADTQIRSLKLTFMEDVGKVGWQLVNTREIIRQEVTGPMARGLLRHYYSPKLSGIRVTDSIKDLGDLSLEVTPASQ